MRKVLLKLSLLFIMLGLKSQATVFFVQHHSDGLFPSPQFTGSLRECITLANSGTPASPDIIIDTVTTSSSITLVAQLPNITTSVIINGVGVMSLGQEIGFEPISDALYGWGWNSNPERQRYLTRMNAAQEALCVFHSNAELVIV